MPRLTRSQRVRLFCYPIKTDFEKKKPTVLQSTVSQDKPPGVWALVPIQISRPFSSFFVFSGEFPGLRSNHVVVVIANLSKDVFERRTLTGSGVFFLFICLDAIKFSLQTFFSLLKTIYPRVLTKPLLNDAKSLLPVDVRRSKTLLLKLPNEEPKQPRR